jgi:hypothetical protein
MELPEIHRATLALEASENYANAGMPINNDDAGSDSQASFITTYEGEKEFWTSVFAGEIPWGTEVNILRLALSEWIGRVPGLFWMKNAARMRDVAENAVESVSEGWKTLKPLGKSQKVMGGVGTLKFPQHSTDGYRLASLSGGLNASAGIPVLISSEVWERHKLKEGKVISSLKAKWQSMSGTHWSESFPTTRGIPKGFLVVKNPDDLKAADETKYTLFHPCTVMEYSSGTSVLYDFVYATADTGNKNHLKYIENFFEQYKNDNDRYGRYLFPAEIGGSLWEAEFDSPEALRDSGPGARSQLELLKARVRAETFSEKSLDSIIKFLTDTYTKQDLRRVSDDIGIPPTVWASEGSDASAAIDFMAVCVRREKIEDLVYKIALEYPESFK